METAPSADHLTAAPSRAVIIGGSVAGIFTAAVAAPFFDEVSLYSAERPLAWLLTLWRLLARRSYGQMRTSDFHLAGDSFEAS